MEIAWIIGGLVIGFVIMKLAVKLIAYIEKQEQK
jgi:NhaP-type Na+/H+ or K+/H+ antiporter